MDDEMQIKFKTYNSIRDFTALAADLSRISSILATGEISRMIAIPSVSSHIQVNFKAEYYTEVILEFKVNARDKELFDLQIASLVDSSTWSFQESHLDRVYYTVILHYWLRDESDDLD